MKPHPGIFWQPCVSWKKSGGERCEVRTLWGIFLVCNAEILSASSQTLTYRSCGEQTDDGFRGFGKRSIHQCPGVTELCSPNTSVSVSERCILIGIESASVGYRPPAGNGNGRSQSTPPFWQWALYICLVSVSFSGIPAVTPTQIIFHGDSLSTDIVGQQFHGDLSTFLAYDHLRKEINLFNHKWS